MTDTKPHQPAYRIGLIVPSSNTTMETEIPQLLDRHRQQQPIAFTFHSSRVRLRQVTPQALLSMNQAATEAVDTLCDAQVDSIMYACLIAAMYGGRSSVLATTEQLVSQAQSNGTHPAVITSAGALVTALAALKARNVSLIAPYKPELTDTVASTLREYGINVRHTRSLSVVDNLAVGRLDPGNLIAVASEMDLSESDALIISACVQMPSLAVIDQAEAKFGIPVLSAATASVYALLTTLGIKPAIAGAGKLLRLPLKNKVMTILPIHDPAILNLVTDEIHQRPVLVQFPTVFVLLAAPTAKGAQQLNATKVRLAGKNYGTAIGSLAKFVAQANLSEPPGEFNCPEHFKALTGTFIRLPFHPGNFQSETIRNGTHQGLLLDGIYSTLFKGIEESFASYAPEAMWNYRNYGAPLCTSCNLSGDPEGSIVAYDKALWFAQTRCIRLFVTAPEPSAEKGSYPIFGFQRDRVRIHREGPGLHTFKEKIPVRLRDW